MRSLEVREIDKVYSGAEKVWQEYTQDLTFYHGTSTLYLPQIRQYGLPVQHSIYNVPEIRAFTALIEKIRIQPPLHRSGFFVAKRSFVALDNYALWGSETLFDYHQAVSTDEWLQSRIKEEGEEELVRQALVVLNDFFNKHRPSLIRIKPESIAMNNFISSTFPQFEIWRKCKDVFVKDVRDAVVEWNEEREEHLMDEEGMAYGILDYHDSIFEDMKVLVAIPPEELEVISDQEMLEIGYEYRRTRRIASRFFTDINEQPTLLLERLANSGRRPSNNSEYIDLMKRFGMSDANQQAFLRRLGFIR